MPTTTGLAAPLLIALLALTTAACDTEEQPSTSSSAPTTASPDAPAQAMDRVGSILPGAGWTLVDAEGVTSTRGEYEVNASAAAGVEPPEVTLTWRRARDFDDYVADRGHVSTAEPVQVVGASGMLYTYSDHDFTVIRVVEGASFIELRGTFLSRAEFDAFLVGLRTATEAEFAAAVADAGITPER